MLDNLCTGPLAIIMINYISYLCNTGEYNGGRRTMVFYMTVMKCKVEEYNIFFHFTFHNKKILASIIILYLPKFSLGAMSCFNRPLRSHLHFAFEPLKHFRFDQNLQLRV